ncbi:MAG: hypothetical protein O3A84_04465 [Proteobacteria bacterium]|nr:hypothetical protein [Pseudomonadota bacterium]
MPASAQLLTERLCRFVRIFFRPWVQLKGHRRRSRDQDKVLGFLFRDGRTLRNAVKRKQPYTSVNNGTEDK